MAVSIAAIASWPDCGALTWVNGSYNPDSVQGLGPGDAEALHIIHADLDQLGACGGFLNELPDRANPELPADRDDRARPGQLGGIAQKVLDDDAIDLEKIQ